MSKAFQITHDLDLSGVTFLVERQADGRRRRLVATYFVGGFPARTVVARQTHEDEPDHAEDFGRDVDALHAELVDALHAVLEAHPRVTSGGDAG